MALIRIGSDQLGEDLFVREVRLERVLPPELRACYLDPSLLEHGGHLPDPPRVRVRASRRAQKDLQASREFGAPGADSGGGRVPRGPQRGVRGL